MANLTVEQPNIKVLKVEIHNGLKVERSQNSSQEDYNISTSSILGAPTTYYVPKKDTRSILDNFEPNHRPYVIAVTALIESPMKMYVQNQNYSKILFGSDDKELVKNVVRFEANVTYWDLLKMLPVNNKPSMKWKITDFNNLMNENPYFWRAIKPRAVWNQKGERSMVEPTNLSYLIKAYSLISLNFIASLFL